MRKVNYKEKGITLIALVITIIILLILAGVTLTTALGQNGLFERAKYAGEKYKESEADEAEKLGDVEKEIDKIVDGQDPTEEGKGPNGKVLVTTLKTTNHGKEEAEDRLGNPVTVPGEFKVVEGETVEDGIVIEDDEGNQFVWIPVSNIDGDNDVTTEPNAEDLIKLKNNTKVEITLGRYKYKREWSTGIGYTDGTPNLVQKGVNYAESTVLNGSDVEYYEYTDDKDRSNGGAGAKDLAKFVQSVQDNHGYYLARYEASYKSDDKPYSKPSTSYSEEEIDYTSGMLWNNVTQGDASKVSQNMYSGEDSEAQYVVSDLVNSYAWDTAVVYIQAMGNENYANQGRGNNTTLKNTGDTEEVKCNIYDMAGNVSEWTTEYSARIIFEIKSPCVLRGGSYYKSSYYTGDRYYIDEAHNVKEIGFRPLLYLK